MKYYFENSQRLKAKRSILNIWQDSKSQHHIQKINFSNQPKFHFRIGTFLISTALLISSHQVFRLQSFLSLYLHVYHIKQIVSSSQASGYTMVCCPWLWCTICTCGRSRSSINRSTMGSIPTVRVMQETKICCQSLAHLDAMLRSNRNQSIRFQS